MGAAFWSHLTVYRPYLAYFSQSPSNPNFQLQATSALSAAMTQKLISKLRYGFVSTITKPCRTSAKSEPWIISFDMGCLGTYPADDLQMSCLDELKTMLESHVQKLYYTFT